MIVSVHRLLLRAALAASAVLMAGGCAPFVQSAGPAPAEWNAQSSAGEIAAWARQGCRRAQGGKSPCMERTLVGVLGQAGVAKGMEVLDTLLAVDADVRSNGHELAHALGIAAFQSPETMAASFVACPATQGAGCHHGVVQGYFLSLMRQGRLPGTPELDALCEPHRANTFLYGQCGHGMGHGLMTVHENHVPASLEACDLASDGYIRESCYSGIFMENIVLVTHPHHTTEGHAAAGGSHGQDEPADSHDAHGESASADAHGGHDAHGGDADGGGHGMRHAAWKALDRDDPLYPCNAVATRYQPACYVMQTGAIFFFNGGNVDATATACEGAPEAMIPICFGSLGRDAIAFQDQDHRRSLAVCERLTDRAGGRGGEWCMIGVVQNLVNLAADPAEGMRFCREVSSDAHKRECYRAVGEQSLTLVAGDAQRAASCEGAEAGFVAACRLGARLSVSIPGDVGAAEPR